VSSRSNFRPVEFTTIDSHRCASCKPLQVSNRQPCRCGPYRNSRPSRATATATVTSRSPSERRPGLCSGSRVLTRAVHPSAPASGAHILITRSMRRCRSSSCPIVLPMPTPLPVIKRPGGPCTGTGLFQKSASGVPPGPRVPGQVRSGQVRSGQVYYSAKI
jgi:hypothetical protein